MGPELTQEEIDALMNAVAVGVFDGAGKQREGSMPILKYCIVVDDKVFCYDVVRKKYVEAELTPKENSVVSEEIEKLIVMKRFNLKE